jgi:hypothetical protein
MRTPATSAMRGGARTNARAAASARQHKQTFTISRDMQSPHKKLIFSLGLLPRLQCACKFCQPVCLVLRRGRMARKHTDDDTPTPAGLRHTLAAASDLSAQAIRSSAQTTQTTVLGRGAHILPACSCRACGPFFTPALFHAMFESHLISANAKKTLYNFVNSFLHGQGARITSV